ncbi:hypothetical protein ACVIIW_000040 [Bradyrhizobium sp. USDA 4449]
MANILATQSAEMRAKGEAMIQQADSCGSLRGHDCIAFYLAMPTKLPLRFPRIATNFDNRTMDVSRPGVVAFSII